MTKAEQNVIRRAALVASWLPEVYRTHKAAAAVELYDLRVAVKELEAEREQATNLTAEGIVWESIADYGHGPGAPRWKSVGTDDDGTHLCMHGNPRPGAEHGCTTCG